MNKTNVLAISAFEEKNDYIEAQQVLKELYPDIEYVQSTDSFKYRGYEFDYFKSGISLNGGKNSYMLVDKANVKLWLFTYGDLEKRWKDFVKNKNIQGKFDKKLPWYKSIFRLI